LLQITGERKVKIKKPLNFLLPFPLPSWYFQTHELCQVNLLKALVSEATKLGRLEEIPPAKSNGKERLFFFNRCA